MKIAVAGKMRSGKDTLAKYFIENANTIQLAFGDEIKEIVSICFPNEVAKGKPRKLYQQVGQFFREIYPNVWVDILEDKLDSISFYGHQDFIVTDVRQANEYRLLKSRGFTFIKVEADDEVRRKRIAKAGDVVSEEDFHHETETAVDSLPFDYLIENNGTLEDFMAAIKSVHEEMERVDATWINMNRPTN
ncbi:AAA family ATPase [Bacillus sp. Bos-x628]|uniref:deoxynucleotide monophosphate kinase family protein n=1 Tax=Bacillus maqinnsis TaxID=3229854 RepID=UPI00338EDB1B